LAAIIRLSPLDSFLALNSAMPVLKRLTRPKQIPKAAAARLAAVLAKLELNMNPTAVALEPGMTLGTMGHSLRDLV